MMLQYLCYSSYFRVYTITASLPIYGFCSILGPRMEEKVSIVGTSPMYLRVLIALPSPTTLFCAKLLIAICVA
jgi:hypothetical protein